MLVDQCVFPIS